MIKWLKITFYKSRLKYHYLAKLQVSDRFPGGRHTLESFSLSYIFHNEKVTEYKLKLRALGEDI